MKKKMKKKTTTNFLSLFLPPFLAAHPTPSISLLRLSIRSAALKQSKQLN